MYSSNCFIWLQRHPPGLLDEPVRNTSRVLETPRLRTFRPEPLDYYPVVGIMDTPFSTG
ncbi:hypothetical protein BJX76DRAFT_337136 [Aspergillus varians]